MKAITKKELFEKFIGAGSFKHTLTMCCGVQGMAGEDTPRYKDVIIGWDVYDYPDGRSILFDNKGDFAAAYKDGHYYFREPEKESQLTKQIITGYCDITPAERLDGICNGEFILVI